MNEGEINTVREKSFVAWRVAGRLWTMRDEMTAHS
jgi:hypothetical protein